MFNSKDRIGLILESINIIEERMLKIKTDEDFISSKDGLTILDAITMRLQTIGENFSKINKQDPSLIEDTLKIDINPIIGFRNIISHHYELLDYQIIFKICTEQLSSLKQVISGYLSQNK
ncbi:MAG TPA: HepT-like ribonuclease domain-containing protein [Chitinophagaceae bacterium]|nr:HepT-like ribonuclease domain-containing protein [Chitinophagaceae bacterium]